MKGRVLNVALPLFVVIAALALGGCDRDRPVDNTGAGGSSVNSGKTPTATFSVGGNISGLTTSGLSLGVSGNSVSAAAGATSFTLPNLFAAGAAYKVSVLAQPRGQTCSVVSGSGNIGTANVTNVQVTCSINSYSIGGTITGLSAGGLVLTNGDDSVTVPVGASFFTFPTKVASGSTYAVMVQTQPAGLTCQLINASGTVTTAAITNVMVVCGQWVWQSGASTTGSAGSYGSEGTPAPGNVPGAREAAASWIDAAGNLWLFGGSATAGDMNDLWQYSIGSGQWTWVGGTSAAGAPGIYGTQGSAAPGNVPGARESAASWIDAAGNLWLFGGTGYDAAGTRGSLNDLWKYDVTARQWTWISGANSAGAPGVYGTQGSAAAGNAPGARIQSVSWVDASGKLWLFGGTGNDSLGNAGQLNDLWQFDPGTALWTWVSGAQSGNALGVYGTQGAAAAGDAPGGRSQAAGWIDASGRLWLFGGSGYGSIGATGLLNDLWAFDPGTGLWVWMSGSQTVNSAGIFGTQSASASMPKMPGGRSGAAAAVDAAGNLWLFGGTGYDSARTKGALNDLWQYNLAAGQWIWMGGAQTAGVAGNYGSQSVAASTNAPGARTASSAWIDSAGDFWLFGGQGEAATRTAGLLNDLWEFAQ
jgi:N-acetylneuraminic acid mutarotase